MRGALDQRFHMVIQAAVQMPVTGFAGHQPSLGETTEGVRDRRPLGAHERPSSRWVKGKVSRSPAGSTRPQRAARCHRINTSLTSRRGWQEIARSTERSPALRSARRNSA